MTPATVTIRTISPYRRAMRPCAGDDDEIARTVDRVNLRQGVAGGFANLDGAIFVFLYLSFLVPPLEPAPRQIGFWFDITTFLVFLTASTAPTCSRRNSNWRAKVARFNSPAETAIGTASHRLEAVTTALVTAGV